VTVSYNRDPLLRGKLGDEAGQICPVDGAPPSENRDVHRKNVGHLAVAGPGENHHLDRELRRGRPNPPMDPPAFGHHVPPPVVAAVDDETDRPVGADRRQKGLPRLRAKTLVGRAMKVRQAAPRVAGSVLAIAIAAADDPVITVPHHGGGAPTRRRVEPSLAREPAGPRAARRNSPIPAASIVSPVPRERSCGARTTAASNPAAPVPRRPVAIQRALDRPPAATCANPDCRHPGDAVRRSRNCRSLKILRNRG